MKSKLVVTCIALALRASSSPYYSQDVLIVAESLDVAGRRTTSASYTHDGSAGGISGISTVSGETAKHGYIGQLYEPAALQLTSPSVTLPEGGTLPVSALMVMDDATLLPVTSTSVTWSVPSGPLAVENNGLATAGTVYQDTAATVQGMYSGFTGTLGLSVLDSVPDNFGTYAGDGLGDAWQVRYFGFDNADAGPLLDPDGDGQDNRFECIAGLVPTDPQSFFSLAIQPVAGAPAQRRLVFGPCLPDRTYQILASRTLLPGSWSEPTGIVVEQDGDQRTATDMDAADASRFYRVEIVKP